MKIMHVVGARPNFMKVAPVMSALRDHASVEQTLVHTGQHYDAQMSEIFFDQLGLPRPDVNLEVGSSSHAVQTAAIMTRFEKLVIDQRPDWVTVYGDINSTLAAALVTAKMQIKTAHVEAGLRSFDRTMPEEINRIIVDQISDVLFTSSPEAKTNLMREGIPQERIQFVGNVMIDTLVRLLPVARERHCARDLKLDATPFALVTLHRPANVDDPQRLEAIFHSLLRISRDMPVVFPAHPRVRERVEHLAAKLHSDHMHIIAPLGYIEFLSLECSASLVITDSGGVQEETTVLGIPCLTLRENTERPVTVEMGTNTLVCGDPSQLEMHAQSALSASTTARTTPPLWDGRASERIARFFASICQGEPCASST